MVLYLMEWNLRLREPALLGVVGHSLSLSSFLAGSWPASFGAWVGVSSGLLLLLLCGHLDCLLEQGVGLVFSALKLCKSDRHLPVLEPRNLEDSEPLPQP